MRHGSRQSKGRQEPLRDMGCCSGLDLWMPSRARLGSERELGYAGNQPGPMGTSVAWVRAGGKLPLPIGSPSLLCSTKKCRERAENVK